MNKNQILNAVVAVLCFCAITSACKAAGAKRVFCFYYNWYQTPAFDGRDEHWSHWINGKDHGFPGGDNIGSDYFPLLGNYSTKDPAIIARHMKMIAGAGIDAIFLTYWGKDHFTAESIPVIFEEAGKAGVKVGFHIEPYGGRDPASVKADIKYIIDTWGRHPAFYRSDTRKPLFFIYDSYLSKADQWAEVLHVKGSNTIRNTPYDGEFIGLWVKSNEQDFFLKSGFDGFYTYFVSKVFVYGSDPKNWPEMQEWALRNGKQFIPCVGPGYIDERIRPENSVNTQDRKNGKYYDDYWKQAIAVKPQTIAITSFNEWHEGTQIEPAKPFKTNGFTYLDYRPLKEDFYLVRTRYWSDQFLKR